MSTIIYGRSDDLIKVVSENSLHEFSANLGETRIKIEGDGERFIVTLEYDNQRDGVWDVKIPTSSTIEGWERTQSDKVTDEVPVDYTDIVKLDIELDDVEKIN